MQYKLILPIFSETTFIIKIKKNVEYEVFGLAKIFFRNLSKVKWNKRNLNLIQIQMLRNLKF